MNWWIDLIDIQWKPISCLDRSRSPRGPLISCFKASVRKLIALIALQSRKRRQGCPKSAEIDDEFWMQSSDIDDIEVCEVCEAIARVAECEASEISRSFQFFFMPISYYLVLSCLMLWFTTNITSHCIKVYHNHIVSYWYHIIIIISIHSLWHSDVSRHFLIMLSQILLYYILLDFYVIFYHIMLLCYVILRHDIM